jgi:hypothetical protein
VFEVDIKVNGTMVGVLHGRNVLKADDDHHLYEYYYHDLEHHLIYQGEVFHNSGDGIFELVSAMLRHVDGQRR